MIISYIVYKIKRRYHIPMHPSIDVDSYKGYKELMKLFKGS